MNPQKFEDICRRSRLVPEKKVETPKGTIYLAEGYFNHHPEFPDPHFKTLWAVARNGLDLAQPLYFKFGPDLPEKRLRLAKAEQTAWEFLNAGNH